MGVYKRVSNFVIATAHVVEAVDVKENFVS